MGKTPDIGLVAQIEEALKEITFEPTAAQRKAKVKLMALIQDNPMFSLEDITMSSALEITKERRIRAWWDLEGFQDWFKNKNEMKQRFEELLNIGQDALERILSSKDPRFASAQVNTMKALFEVAGKNPAKQKEIKFSDESINKMDPIQLEEFLQKAGRGLLPDKLATILLEGEASSGSDETSGSSESSAP